MGVEELGLAIVRKIRGENAVRAAFSTLVFACGASLGAVTNPAWNAHLLRFRRMILRELGVFPPCDSLFFLPFFWRWSGG